MDFETHIICGEEVRILVPRSYADCIELIRSDSFRHNGRRDSLPRILLGAMSRTSMAFSLWFRLSQHRGWAYPITKLMLKQFKRGHGLLIPPRMRVGYGMYI